MHGWTNKWLASLLVSAVLCAASAAWAQNGTYLAGPIDPAYAAASDQYGMAPQVPASEATFNNASMLAEKDLAKEVADLKKTVKKLTDKADADKKKAAESPSVKVGGRLMFDVAAFDQNDASILQAGDMFNGTEFRRARLQASGEAFHVIDWKIQYDFAGSGQTAFKDVYFGVKELPLVGNVRVGHFYECWGLEAQTSSNYITFMERSLISGTGGIGDRKSGIMAFDWTENERATWAVGAFFWQVGERPPTFPSGTVYDDAGGGAIDMRLTGLPWYDEATNGRGLLHTGISATYREVAELRPGQTGRYSLSAKPEANLGTAVVNTTQTSPMNDASRVSALSPEMAFVYGPFSVQSEYEWIWVTRSASASPTFDGGYIYCSYFLTGENRVYDRKAGVFSRVKPFTNFFRVRDEDGCVQTGIGAWEVGYRLSYLNLTDAGIQGGRVVDQTVGLNWYLNPYTRFMFNFVHSETTARDGFDRGIVNLFETRAQFDF